MNVESARLLLLVGMFLGYLALCLWAFAPRNRARFEAYAEAALDDAPPKRPDPAHEHRA